MGKMKTDTRKQKHLTLDDRVVIETGLTAGKSMRTIALELGKDPLNEKLSIDHLTQHPHTTDLRGK